jgi:hypothetical protein
MKKIVYILFIAITFIPFAIIFFIAGGIDGVTGTDILSVLSDMFGRIRRRFIND